MAKVKKNSPKVVLLTFEQFYKQVHFNYSKPQKYFIAKHFAHLPYRTFEDWVNLIDEKIK